MNFKEIIQKSEIFIPRPTYDKTEIIFYLILLSLFLVITILLKKSFDKKSKIINPYSFFSQKYFANLITCIIIGFVLLFFRWQAIPYFATPILIYIDLLITIIILLAIVVYIKRYLPQEINNFNQKNNYIKYIPTPRKK